MNSSTEDSTSIQQINTSIQKLYDFLFESGFRSAKKASKDDLIDKIIYFEEFIHNHSNNLCAFGDHLLACFCLLLVPTMDSEIRSIVWDVVIQIIAYCIAFDINLIQWKQLFNTAFAFSKEEIALPIINIGVSTNVKIEDMCKQCAAMIQATEPFLKEKKTIERWWNFLAENVFPSILDVAATREHTKFKHLASILFLNHTVKLIDLKNKITPFSLDENGEMKIGKLFTDMLGKVVEYSQSDKDRGRCYIVSLMFIEKAFPCVISSMIDLNNAQSIPQPSPMSSGPSSPTSPPQYIEFNGIEAGKPLDIEQFMLSLGQLKKNGSKLSELLSWFDARFSDDLIPYLDDITKRYAGSGEFFFKMILSIYHNVEPGVEILNEVICKKQPFIPALTNMMVLLLTIRTMTKYMISVQRFDRNFLMQLPNLFLTNMNNQVLLPLIICSYTTIIFDIKTFDIFQASYQLKIIKSKTAAIQLLTTTASQIAITLAPVLFKVTPEDAEKIQKNPVVFERELGKTTCNTNNIDNSMVFFFYLSSKGWTEEEASTFLLNFIQAFDSITDYLIAPSVIDALSQVYPPTEPAPQLFIEIMKYMMSIRNKIPSKSLPTVISSIVLLIKEIDSNKINDEELRIEWLKTLVYCIDNVKEKELVHIVNVCIDEILGGRPLAFILLPLILFIGSDLLEVADPKLLDKLLSFFTMVAMMPSIVPDDDMKNFYKENMPNKCSDNMQVFLSGNMSLPKIAIQKVLCSIQIIKTSAPYAISYIFCIIIKQLLVDDNIYEELGAFISHYSCQPQIPLIFFHLISIMPFFYDRLIEKKKDLFATITSILMKYSNEVEKNPQSFEIALRTATDFMLVSADSKYMTEAIKNYFFDAEDKKIKEAIRKEARFFTKNFLKETGNVEMDLGSKKYRFNIDDDVTIYGGFGEGSFKVALENDLGSSEYEISTTKKMNVINAGNEEEINKTSLPSPGASLFFDVIGSMLNKELPNGVLVDESEETKPNFLNNLIPVTVFCMNEEYESVCFARDKSETTKVFNAFFNSLGKFVDAKELHITGQVPKDGKVLFWETWRYKVLYHAVHLLDGSVEESKNDKLVLVWCGNKTVITPGSFKNYVPNAEVFLFIYPIRKSICRVKVVSLKGTEVGPLRGELIVPTKVLVPLVQWTLVIANNS